MYIKVDLFMDAVNLQRSCVVCACYQCTMRLRFLSMLIIYNEVVIVVVYVTFHFLGNGAPNKKWHMSHVISGNMGLQIEIIIVLKLLLQFCMEIDYLKK